MGMRLIMNCPALKQDNGFFEDLSVLTKFALVQQVVSRVQRGPIIRQLLLCVTK